MCLLRWSPGPGAGAPGPGTPVLATLPPSRAPCLLLKVGQLFLPWPSDGPAALCVGLSCCPDAVWVPCPSVHAAAAPSSLGAFGGSKRLPLPWPQCIPQRPTHPQSSPLTGGGTEDKTERTDPPASRCAPETANAPGNSLQNQPHPSSSIPQGFGLRFKQGPQGGVWVNLQAPPPAQAQGRCPHPVLSH